VLRSKFYDSEKIDAIVRDFRIADLEPKEKALLVFVDKVLKNSSGVGQADIDQLKSRDFSDEDIFNIILTATSRSFFSRVIDTIGFSPPSEWLGKMEELLGEKAFKTLTVGRNYKN
jgi:alkylhydroperoxidase family enzyme